MLFLIILGMKTKKYLTLAVAFIKMTFDAYVMIDPELT